MIEIIRPATLSDPRVALFDFDGTLSTIRSGWTDVMIPWMVDVLLQLKTGETPEQLTTIVRDFVSRLTGRQTIYQMIQLAEEVRKRGGRPQDPLDYKRTYLQLLSQRIAGRIQFLREGGDPDHFLVPGARRLLEALTERGLRLYLASGTDHPYVLEEARLLHVAHFFGNRIFGAIDEYTRFSKAILIQQILQSECCGEQLLSFGDGYVEIENVKAAGGVAVGVATDEPECRCVDEWKRQRLIAAGADYIIPNYLAVEELLAHLRLPAPVE